MVTVSVPMLIILKALKQHDLNSPGFLGVISAKHQTNNSSYESLVIGPIQRAWQDIKNSLSSQVSIPEFQSCVSWNLGKAYHDT